ncbi:ImmA/IrrE family metallo-endopeptidase [Streptomyces sp. AC495_CC817]|uniref:ImmA/IrrE family metallo-endopeptidase n=1 Tax=Streptomyces sp. AC495_CC817 TaxID=2823900 RepID=UPI001C27B35C|nr:ImmA/IrrE family metallo-endopeptidase [Streptomyces sp. AC495_CC817]
MDQLLSLIEEHGLRVVERDGSTRGGFDPRSRSIRIAPGMSERTTRSVLAHELAHAVLGHAPSADRALRERQEQRADEWAARLLITPAAYAAAEFARGPHPPSLAFDLGVTVEIVLAFQRLLHRERPA